MKKIKAFIAAFLLLLVFVATLHGVTNSISLKSGSGFKTWYNQYKDKSYQAISSNMDKKTMMVFGSSEFGHHQKSWYHLKNMFKDRDLNALLIGQPYTQSINHTIALAALSKNTTNNKVVMVVSPTWFRGDGIDPNAFSIRFSDSEYIEMLKDDRIKRPLKEKIIKRVVGLLANDKKTLSRVKLYNKVYFEKDQQWTVRSLETIVERMRKDQENSAVKLAMLFEKAKYQRGKATIQDPHHIDWQKFKEKAYKQSLDESKNPLYIKQDQWKRKFSKKWKRMKNAHKNDELTKSEEFKDLELFLQVARANNKKVQLILQPINGYWYDHTGMSKKRRKECYEKIHAIADKYKAEVADLSSYTYEPYVLSDAVHPWKRGWVLINEAIFNFYQKNDLAKR
ncbi:D-alanyl-lipoteichoic acid biosynthesis protein DltD [Atopobacter sp. AH10]|uniref:D-alanyl-lipoteichoic acid biosynthesis protein DltD n=1 Tax=Atopobacter sp. AH10 TaxID=2315861 RepID=UPI000EF1E178|nr:D-alanyl-lipoteichoic acid biosynthesis protein DltD [Atopobacter sp. AH10]RLK63110.1 D-alanyl-lipoteichoic acid biosynthesis protein DltD [Atopobacter sp. AH10]